MATFAIFANGTYWGNINAADETAAITAAAAEWGTEGNADGIRAFEVSESEAAEVEAWWFGGADAAECPACVSH